MLRRLIKAVNEHDLDGIVGCFADDYVNETPAHPPRGFRGNEQVRTNWKVLLAGVPDIHAEVLDASVDGETLWTEWEMVGTRTDGELFLMRGVVIYRVRNDVFASARFYLEAVEETSGDVDAHTHRVVGRVEEAT